MEAINVSRHIDMVARLSNLALQLYSWYIEHGHARNVEDEKDVKKYMKDALPVDALLQTGFYERLYLYQAFTWYAFIRQDFLMYYRYTQKWVELFHEQPLMVRVETGHLIKGLHNLLNAHFDLRNHKKFILTLRAFEDLAQTDRVQQHDSFRIQAFVYITTAKMNQHFMQGSFRDGLHLVPEIEEKLEEYSLFLDKHRILVLNYKIATLYFGSGDFATSIDYLQRIIHDHVDLRYDLQCYARLMHLLAHYELGNFEIMEYLTKSVYRFMAKMGNLTRVEEEMFKFLRHSFGLRRDKLRSELTTFLATIRQFEKSRFETRAFAYLDIISWVESKVFEKPMSEIIKEKFIASKRSSAVQTK
jgi:hypothetical protein